MDAEFPPQSSISTLASDIAKDEGTLSERTVPILVRGIIADAQHLIVQQVAMFRQAIRDDVRNNKRAVLFLTVGVLITAAVGILLLLMLPLLLNSMVPSLPMWACFGIMGGLLFALGGVALYMGFKKIESFDLISNQAVEAFKENMKWTTKPT